MPTWIRLSLLLLAALFAAGCDSQGNDEERLRGTATFDLMPLDPTDEVLSLRLRSGVFQPPGRPYEMELGNFLAVPWRGGPGSLAVDGAGLLHSTLVLPSAATFGLPGAFLVESGSLVVAEAGAGRVAGPCDVAAVEAPAIGVDGGRREVRMRGAFVAMRGPQG